MSTAVEAREALPEEAASVPARPDGVGLFVGGGWRRPSRTAPDHDPANGRVLAEVADATAQEVDDVVVAAAGAADEWSRVPAHERGLLVQRIAARIREEQDDLAILDAVDSGNPLAAARFDVGEIARVLHWVGGLGLELKGETIPTTPGALDFTLREPFGVAARVTAFNHPTLFAGKALGAPLVAGNAVVIKPSPWTPLSATRLVEIAAEVLPAGVVSLVTGGVEPALALARHPLVRRIAVTGSVDAGLAITRAAAEVHVKHVSLELGGKNPLIALPDADAAAVARAAVGGMNLTSSAGQSCGSTSRLLVHRSLHGRVVEAIAAQMEELRLGHPLDPDTRMGPLVSEGQRAKSESFVEIARRDGARVVSGGARPDDARLRDGFFYRPTLLDEVRPESRVARDEIFGPVLSVLPWEDERDALAMANATRYGLTASIWTNDLSRAVRFAREVRAGYVWINGVSHHQLGSPFGGYGDSGTGREESVSELLSYTQVKNVNVSLPAWIDEGRR